MECPTYSRAQRSAGSGQTGREWTWRAADGQGCREEEEGRQEEEEEGKPETICQPLGATGSKLLLADLSCLGISTVQL